MTLSYTLRRDDDMFLQEHFALAVARLTRGV